MATDLEAFAQSLGNQTVTAIVTPISNMLNQQLAKIAGEARLKLATDQNVDQSQITDLAVAEYIAGIPTAQLTAQVSTQMVDIGHSVRNGLIIGFGMISIAMIINGMQRHHDDKIKHE